MKQAIYVILLLFLSVFAYAEDAVTQDTVTLEDAAIASEAVPDAVVTAEVTANVPDDGAFTAIGERLKYAFTFNKEKKAQLALDLAKRKLLLSQKMALKNNEKARENMDEQYARWSERAKGAIEALPADTTLEVTAKIQNRIELNKELAQNIRARLENASLSAEQKAKIIARLEAAKKNAMELKIAATLREKEIEKRLSEVEKLSVEDIEERRIAARLGENGTGTGLGAQKSAEAFVNIAKKDVAKARSILESNPDADAQKLQKASEMIAEAEKKLLEAEDDLAAGKYSEAKSKALEARRTVMDAYIRSRFNALSPEAKEKLATMTPEEKARVLERVRAGAVIKEREDVPEKANGKLCAQVITPAANPRTGKCEEFSTPCEVPIGWRKVESCTNAVANTVQEVDSQVKTDESAQSETRLAGTSENETQNDAALAAQ